MRIRPLLATLAVSGLVLAACGNNDPLATEEAPAEEGATTLTVGSANFPESEILAEVYAQALEADGVTVERQPQIGARDIYLAALEDGSIDMVPEYTGNLLQYYEPSTEASSPEEVNAALVEALPEGLSVGEPAPAENKDAYHVTAEFSSSNDITSLEDLADYEGALRVGGNPELAERPYGPQGLVDVYGVPSSRLNFVAISDSGGPLTIQALNDGDVELANIYTTTPAIEENGFVTLEDPQNMIMPQSVVPLVSQDKATEEVTATLDEVSAALTTEDLTAMNARNQGEEKASPAVVAGDWLEEEGLA